MKSTTWCAWALCACIVATAAVAGEPQTNSKDDPMAHASAEMAAWMKYASPGENHRHLDVFEGSWDISGKYRMAPNAPWIESKSTSKSEWVLDGRFLLTHVEGQGMMGGTFKGIGIMGYDNLKEKYVSVWMDNMGTMIMSAEGEGDESGKVFNLSGKFDDPAGGEKRTYRAVTRVVNDDKIVDEMYASDQDGNEFKNMELIYTRK